MEALGSEKGVFSMLLHHYPSPRLSAKCAINRTNMN